MLNLHFFKVDLRAKITHFYLTYITRYQMFILIYVNTKTTLDFIFLSITNTIHTFIY